MKIKEYKKFLLNKDILYLVFQVFGIFVSLFSAFTFLKWGPIISSDTISYFNMANKVVDGFFPYSTSYSPGYPFLMGILKNIFNSSYQYLSILISFFILLISIYIWYKVLEKTLRIVLPLNFYLILSVIIINFWWFIKIVYSAHADSFFCFFILLISLQILLWIERPAFIRFVFISILASISIWVKYNGLIFLPILIILILLKKNLRKKIFYVFFSVLCIISSFLLFRFFNDGEVIHHLETSRSFALWQGYSSVETFLVNMNEAGSVFIQYFISNLYRNFSNNILNYFSTFLLFTFSLFYFRKVNQNFIGFVFYIFFVTYIIGYIFISHFSNHTEINQRTMFPAYIFLTISLLAIFKDLSIFFKSVFILFLFVNVSRSLLGFADWMIRAPMDSFNKIESFKKKKSLNSLKYIMDQKGIPPNFIYTNNFRYLAAYLDFQFVNIIPDRTQFIRGKFREKSEDQFNVEIEDLRNNLVLGKSIVVLFDYKGDIEILDGLHCLKIIVVENDLIIYNE